MIRFILLAFLLNLLASIASLFLDGVVGQNVPLLVVLFVIVLFIVYLLSRNFIPKAKPDNLELLELNNERINYRGLISYVSPILVNREDPGLTRREKILNVLTSTLSEPEETLSKIKKYYGTSETKKYEPILKLIEQSPKIDYVWLISSNSEAMDDYNTKANSFIDAKILQSAIKGINSNIVVFMPKENKDKKENPLPLPLHIMPGTPWHQVLIIKLRLRLMRLIKRKVPAEIPLHIDNLWSNTVLNNSYNIVDSIYENHLPYLGLRERDVLTEATTGPAVMRYGLLLATLPDNRDITISLEKNISYLCKFSTIAQIKEK